MCFSKVLIVAAAGGIKPEDFLSFARESKSSSSSPFYLDILIPNNPYAANQKVSKTSFGQFLLHCFLACGFPAPAAADCGFSV